MGLFEGKTPAERNKMIAALALGAISLLFVMRLLFFNSGSTPPATARRPTNSNSKTLVSTLSNRQESSSSPAQEASPSETTAQLTPPQPVPDARTPIDPPEVGRNIFAFYVKPTPPPTPLGPNTPTPTPTPPITLGSVAPSNVYARTGDFELDATGDKFTPLAHVYLDGQELATRFMGVQRLAATVPATLIASPGSRQIMVRTPDGQLYSNPATLNVMQPPTPPYTYVGIVATTHHKDIALLKDEGGKLINVRLGDVLSGRFRVSGISERNIEFTDTQLRISHSVPFTANADANRGNPSFRNMPQQPQQPTTDDDEP